MPLLTLINNWKNDSNSAAVNTLVRVFKTLQAEVRFVVELDDWVFRLA